jgi:glutathione peroxidase
MFAKIEVNGADECELYTWLKSQKANPDGAADLGWNFTKFLVGKDGEVLERFEPQTTPEQIGEYLDTLK